MSSEVSARRQREVIGALRRGTVPETGLDLLAVGLDRFSTALDEELDTVAAGGAVFKAVRGEYGSGKTFFTRHLAERALRRGFATAEVQVSETQTPLHRLETVYRRVTESLRTTSVAPSAFRPIIDSWLYTLEDEAIALDAALAEADSARLSDAVGRLLEARLRTVSRQSPLFAQALRGYQQASGRGDDATADGLAAWMGGQPQVAAGAKRAAGIRGDLDHFGAMAFLQGLLVVLRDAGHPGLLLVLDEVETLQRVRGDMRDKALNALRQLIDEVDSGRFPGLYLVITGTPAFFDGPSGVHPATTARIHLGPDLATDPRFDNPRAIQLRLPGFTPDSLTELGAKVRDLYATGSQRAASVDDVYLRDLAHAVAGELGGQVGIAPRLRVNSHRGRADRGRDQFPRSHPRQHYALTVTADELTGVEKAARGAASVDEIDLELP